MHLFFRLIENLALLREHAIVNYDEDNNSKGIKFDDQVIRIHSLTQIFLESHQTHQDVDEQLEKIAGVFIKDLETCRDAALLQDGKMWINHFYKICDDKINDDKKAIFLKWFVVGNHQQLLHDLFLTRGNLSKLLDYFEYICDQQKKLLGEKDPVFLKTKFHLANILLDNHQIEKSLEIIEDTMKLQLEIFDHLHMDYLNSKSILACLKQIMYEKQVSSELQEPESFKMYEEIRESLIETNNKDSYLYNRTLINIAAYFEFINLQDKAIPLLKEVVHVLSTSSGRLFFIAKHMLAECYRQIMNSETSIKLYNEVLDESYKTLGPVHMTYLKIKHGLAIFYRTNSEFQTSFNLYEEILEVELKNHGETHEAYLNTKKDLAYCHKNAGNLNKSIQLYEEILKTEFDTLGPNHKTYLRTKEELSLCYKNAGDKKRGQKLFREVLNQYYNDVPVNKKKKL